MAELQKQIPKEAVDFINGTGQARYVSRLPVKVESVSEEWLNESGWEPQDALGLGWTRLMDASDIDGYLSAYERAFITGGLISASYGLRYADGKMHYHSSIIKPSFDPSGRPDGLTGYAWRE